MASKKNRRKASAPAAGGTTGPESAQRSRIAIRQVYNTLDAYADRMALRLAGPIMFVTGLLAWALNWGVDPIPFSENGRGFGVLIFIFSIVITFGVAAVGFIMGVRYRNRLVGSEQRRSWALAVAPLALAYALVTMALVGIALQLVDTAFKQLALQPIYAVLLVGIACGVVAYYVANRTMQISVRAVLNVFIIILFAGIAFSAVNVNDPLWWEESFSFLGTASSTARTVFNATLIFAGILLIILQQFFMDDFIDLYQQGILSKTQVKRVRSSLIALGVLLAMVGLIPFGAGGLWDTLHSVSAYALAGILLLYMITAHRLLPYFPREFYLMTWVMVVGLVGAVALHLLGSINTVGVELIAFAVGGAWFMMFVKNVEILVDRADRGAVLRP